MTDPPLVLTHGCSLSNLPLFVAAGERLFEAEGLRVEAPFFDDIGSTAQLLATGTADLGTAAFTQPLIDAERPDPPVMVAGSGLMGISVLTREPLENVAELAGRTVGTFRTDPMEVLVHDVLRSAGLTMSDVVLRYLDGPAEAVELWRAGELDAVSLAEPFTGRVRAAGAYPLSDGTELWGDPYPDTTLVASASFLRDRPDDVRAAIRAMLAAEGVIRADPVSAMRHAAGYFPGFAPEELLAAARRQPARVDIRDLRATVFGRWDSLRSLELVSSRATAPPDAVNFALLNDELNRPPAKETNP